MSRTYWLTLRSVDGAAVTAQLITTPERGRLKAYDPEACRVYHGNDVVGRRSIALTAGGVATLIDAWDRESRASAQRLSVLYWEVLFCGHWKVRLD